MKKALVFISAVILLMSCKNGQVTVKTGKEGQILPSVDLLLMDSITQLNTNKIPVDKPIVLFLFSPYCLYCQAQTRQIIDKQASLSGIRFYMVSAFPFNTIKEYNKIFHLDNYPNIIVAQDKKALLEKYFKPGGFPYQAIYSKDKKLQQSYLGIVQMEKIKDFVFE